MSTEQSREFKKLFDETMRELETVCRDFPWETKEAYGTWLAQTYFFVLHSTRLLALTAANFSLQDNEPHQRFLHHIDEEKSHEMLALKDLQHLKMPIASFRELAETSALYQAQYYWIEHKSPFAFFGYIMALEGFAVSCGKHVYSRVRKAHGDKATLFVKVHAEEDVGHLEKAFEQIDKIPQAEFSAFVENFRFSAHFYCRMLTESWRAASLKHLEAA